MKVFKCVILLFIASIAHGIDDIPTNVKAYCSFDVLHKTKLLPTLDGLVGIGWDNLMNKPMLPIFSSTFNQCQVTSDGEFLIPDQIIARSIKKIKFSRHAEYYSNFKDVFEKTTYSLNIGASFPNAIGTNIGGSFGAKYEKVKENMNNTDTSVFITQLDYHAYTIVHEFGTEFHPLLLDRLLAINTALEKNLINRAQYLAEAIIRDYGTHALLRAEIGARIEEFDFVSSRVIASREASLTDLQAIISTGFFKNIVGFNINGTYINHGTANRTIAYAMRRSIITTYGGTDINGLLGQNFRYMIKGEKTKFSVDNIVALDVNGMLLYELISETGLPNMSPTQLENITSLLRNATTIYYEKNLYSGCTDLLAPNYNYIANMDDGSCYKAYSNYTFGGFYQQIYKLGYGETYYVKNQITGTYSCPQGFETINLISSQYYNISWCTSQAEINEKILFGGVFWRYPFGRSSIICLSRRYETEGLLSVPFGGFFSCQSDEKRCEDGYSQFFHGQIDNCDIYYCVRPEKFKQQIPKIQRPPFTEINEKSFELFDPASSTTDKLLLSGISNEKEYSYKFYVIAFISFFAIVFIIIVILFCCKKYKTRNYTPCQSKNTVNVKYTKQGQRAIVQIC